MNLRLPDFVIVGAMKAATSSFAEDLSHHPQIYLAPRELHFFNSEGNYRQGLDFYASHFKDAAPANIIGEKTPSYSYHPLVAARMAEHLPNAKIIWLLREPIGRSYSHYNFFLGKGMERRSFEGAVKREMGGADVVFTQRYLDRSIYVKQINHFLQHFPKSQMLFLLYEDYRARKEETLKRTWQFLGVEDKVAMPPALPPMNVTYLPRSSFVQWVAYRIFRFRGFRIYKIISKLNRRKHSGYPSLDQQTKQYLREHFRPYNEELARVTGLDLKPWMKQ